MVSKIRCLKLQSGTSDLLDSVGSPVLPAPHPRHPVEAPGDDDGGRGGVEGGRVHVGGVPEGAWHIIIIIIIIIKIITIIII